MRVFSHLRIAAGARIVACLGLTLGAVGSVSCYTAGANPAATTNSLSRDLLPLDRSAMRYANLYEAIRYLRPEYLKVREQGPDALVPVAYLNGARLADPTMLRHVPVNAAFDVRWVRPNQPSALYGFNPPHMGGGIFVTTK
jgi:hypothetical protein